MWRVGKTNHCESVQYSDRYRLNNSQLKRWLRTWPRRSQTREAQLQIQNIQGRKYVLDEEELAEQQEKIFCVILSNLNSKVRTRSKQPLTRQPLTPLFTLQYIVQQGRDIKAISVFFLAGSIGTRTWRRALLKRPDKADHPLGKDRDQR